jgi:Mlc titration factor MtfA (ptsG expression regulator)
MLETIIVLALIGLIVTGILVHPLLVKWRQNRLKLLPFPPLWQSIINQNLPVYSCLSADEQRRLQGHIKVFVTEKQFIGCKGLPVTEEMKITIAAVACLLLLNEQGRYFSKLRSILVYPSTYIVREKSYQGNYIIEESLVARLGESWTNDQVVLSWEQIERDTINWQDGHNVILHEFAHQLDQEDGKDEGVPILPKNLEYSIWAKVMGQEYQQLCHEVERKFNTVIDGYGATNPAEFFAVATETFFEKPEGLLEKHPSLYRLLQRYYQLNPLQWV